MTEILAIESDPTALIDDLEVDQPRDIEILHARYRDSTPVRRGVANRFALGVARLSAKEAGRSLGCLGEGTGSGSGDHVLENLSPGHRYTAPELAGDLDGVVSRLADSPTLLDAKRGPCSSPSWMRCSSSWAGGECERVVEDLIVPAPSNPMAGPTNVPRPALHGGGPPVDPPPSKHVLDLHRQRVARVRRSIYLSLTLLYQPGTRGGGDGTGHGGTGGRPGPGGRYVCLLIEVAVLLPAYTSTIS